MRAGGGEGRQHHAEREGEQEEQQQHNPPVAVDLVMLAGLARLAQDEVRGGVQDGRVRNNAGLVIVEDGAQLEARRGG